MRESYVHHTRVLSLALGVMLTAASCGHSAKEDVSPEYQASLAARQCYEALYLHNRPESFLYGRAQMGSMPDDFRQQLLEAYRSHVRQVEYAHQGVTAVDVVRAQVDTTLQCVQVFLALDYGDGEREEMVVPMVAGSEGQWRMK